MVEHRYSDLFLTAREALRPTQGENAANCARELLAAAAGKTTAEIIASRDIYAPADVAEALSGMLARMQRDEPLAYVLGEWDFAGMTLEVTPEVLIPRDDTMAVTELALACAGQLPDHPRILDLCAGSGCIGLAIAQRIPDAHVILGDVSPGALRVARKNIGKQKLQSRVTAMALDATRPAMRFIGKFHLIVSNPPYIPSGQLPTLDRSVRDYEPQLALDGGADGLALYRSIVACYTHALEPSGSLCLEFGLGQEADVAKILEEGGYEITQWKRDASGIMRAVLACKKEKGE